MPDTLSDSTAAPLLTIPEALTTEAAASLLSGNADTLKAVQEKMASALTGQGLPETDASALAAGWLRDFAAGVGADASPDAAIAQANQITLGTAARMAQAVQDAAALTGEQKVAAALAQGQLTGHGLPDNPEAAADLVTVLFNGVMDPLARPAGSVDPVAVLSQALAGPSAAGTVVEATPLSPTDKLTAALASGVAVQDALQSLASDGTGPSAELLERALSNSVDADGIVAAAQELGVRDQAQSQSNAIELSDGGRLLGALASGGGEAAREALASPAFANVLGESLAQGSSADAALRASTSAQTDMTARQDAAVVPPKPEDTLVASLASGRDVAATVQSFASASGLDLSAAGGFGKALESALSSGQEPAGALGTAREGASAVFELSAEAAKGVKGDGLVAALANGQNVEQAVQAVGGSDPVFSAALGQALAEGRSSGQALAAARQAADIAQQNAKASEVPVSAENKALADLATPALSDEGGEKAADGDAAPSDESPDGAETADGEATEQVADADAAQQDEAGDGKEGDGKGEEGDKAEADPSAEAASQATSESSSESSSEATSESSSEAAPAPADDSAPAPAKPAGMAEAALKPISFGPPGGDKSGGDLTGSASQSATGDSFGAASQSQQRLVQAVTRAVENTIPLSPPPPPILVPQPIAAPTLAQGFDAAAFAKALAVPEGTAAPAGFTVFHLIEVMFRPGDAGSSVIGVAVVANQGSTLGVWQYSVDGTNWQEVGAVGEASALVLPGSAFLRFLPVAGASGVAPALGLRAVNDQWTAGFSGAEHTLFALTGTGGTTALSAEVGQLLLEVTGVNGAPVATGLQVVLDVTVVEDSLAPAGASVSSLFGALFSDPSDAILGQSGDSFAGVAVVANPASAAQGTWEYWNGSAWTAVGAVSDGNALLLSADAQLRFLPGLHWNGATPALAVRLVDSSQGAIISGTRIDTAGGGGTTRYSAESIQLAGTITAVNDAPVATGTTATLPVITEDTVNPNGATVFSLFGSLFSDPHDAVTSGSVANTLAGVVVVGNAADATQGLWQYWAGSSWADVGAVSEGSGLLLAGEAKLRFLPAADWNGTTPALTVRLVDDSEGAITSGTRINTAGGGTTTRYSAETIQLTGTVTAVNDAPVATGTAAVLPAVNEDTANPAGATVSSLFGGLFTDPLDAVAGGSVSNTLAGVVVVGNAATATQGLWQYWTGSSWADIGTVSNSSGLLLAAETKLRFLPTADWNGTTPALTVRLVDDSLGVVTSGTRIDATDNGGITRYSAETIQLAGTVTAVNDAPVATGTAAVLPAVNEDTANPAGATVSSLFGGLFTDPLDAVAGGSVSNTLAGVVVVGNAATTAQGLWQYWTGTSWTDVGTVSEGNALLLAAGAKLRFLPTADWNGETPALTVRLVDSSQGVITNGTRVDTAGGGGITRYSAGTIQLTGAVTAVNDAPVATGTAATLPAIAEDTANPDGATVTSLFGSLFSDPADAVSGGAAANDLVGVAIVGNASSASQGVWQYWDGSGWSDVGTVSEGSALIVSASHKLRFMPAADWSGTTPALTVRLVDDSLGVVTSGTRIDATDNGGITRYSAETIQLAGTVTAVNDAPEVHADTGTVTTVKGVAVTVTGLSVSDVDADSNLMLVTLSADHGTLTVDGSGLNADISDNGTGSVTVRATLSTLNSLLANGVVYSAGTYVGTDAVRMTVNDQGNSGPGGPLTGSTSVTVTVVPPNTSPVLADTNLEVSAAAEALSTPEAGTQGIAVSKLVGLGTGPANVTDSDAGAATGIALVGTNEDYGHWWYSTDDGATWSLVGTVNDTDSALLLRSTDRLYFQPNASVPATVNGALTIRAWDRTTGSEGTKVAIDTGAGSAFSSATDSVTLHPGVLVPNGSFDDGLSGWTFKGGTTVDSVGDGHQGTITSADGQSPTELEDFLGLSQGSIAAATGETPFKGHAMKLSSTVTVTQPTTLTFDWSFDFTDGGSYHDFAFVSVNGVVTLLAKNADASGTFSVALSAGSTLSLGFGAFDTVDNSVSPILRVDNVRLTTVASDPIVLDMTGEGLALRSLSEGVHFDVTGDGAADRTGWIGAGNALLVRDENRNGLIDDARELVSEQFGSGFNSSLEALGSLDGNGDGRLDATDAAFTTLQVWRDDNADGISQAGELRTLADAGIRSIATAAAASEATLAGNRILGTTSMTMADGSVHAVAGVAFDVEANGAPQVQAQPQGTPLNTTHGGTDFAALLSAGLGLPDVPSIVPSGAGIHETGWSSDVVPVSEHPMPTHDPAGAHPAGHL